MKIPTVWTEPFQNYIENSLKNEAAKLFRIHQLPNSLETWQKHRVELRKNIWKNLGVYYDNSLDLDLRETGEIQMDGYHIKKLYYQSRPGIYVTGNLYIPDGDGPFPAVVGMHGHWEQGRLAERVQSRGHTLAKNNYVCLQVDAWGAGERSTKHGEFEYHGSGLGGALFNIGESLMGAQLVDNMRAVDVLCSLNYVDSSKIGATGASGGGNQTMWLAAMDERIIAAVPVASVGTFEIYIMNNNCVCECLPNGLTFTEESGVLALIAPRALKICNCLGEKGLTFLPSEMLRSYAEARKVFKAYGKDDKLSYQAFNLPHGYWPEIREAMLGHFDLHLKGLGTGAPKQETAFECLPEKDLMVFEKGKRPLGVISTVAYCQRKAKELKEKNTFSEASTEEKRAELKNILKISSELNLKKCYKYNNDSDWEKYALETSSGRMIPILVRKASGKVNDYVIASSIEGKAGLNGSKYLTDILASPKGIILFDAYACGETGKIDNGTAPFHISARALLWLGKTLYGEWCREYIMLAKWTAQFLGAQNIELFGYKEMGIVAILTGVLSKNIAISCEKTPKSFAVTDKDNANKLSIGFCLPNILKWGDLELATNLNSNKKINIIK